MRYYLLTILFLAFSVAGLNEAFGQTVGFKNDVKVLDVFESPENPNNWMALVQTIVDGSFQEMLLNIPDNSLYPNQDASWPIAYQIELPAGIPRGFGLNSFDTNYRGRREIKVGTESVYLDFTEANGSFALQFLRKNAAGIVEKATFVRKNSSKDRKNLETKLSVWDRDFAPQHLRSQASFLPIGAELPKEGAGGLANTGAADLGFKSAKDFLALAQHSDFIAVHDQTIATNAKLAGLDDAAAVLLFEYYPNGQNWVHKLHVIGRKGNIVDGIIGSEIKDVDVITKQPTRFYQFDVHTPPFGIGLRFVVNAEELDNIRFKANKFFMITNGPSLRWVNPGYLSTSIIDLKDSEHPLRESKFEVITSESEFNYATRTSRDLSATGGTAGTEQAKEPHPFLKSFAPETATNSHSAPINTLANPQVAPVVTTPVPAGQHLQPVQTGPVHVQQFLTQTSARDFLVLDGPGARPIGTAAQQAMGRETQLLILHEVSSGLRTDYYMHAVNSAGEVSAEMTGILTTHPNHSGIDAYKFELINANYPGGIEIYVQENAIISFFSALNTARANTTIGGHRLVLSTRSAIVSVDIFDRTSPSNIVSTSSPFGVVDSDTKLQSVLPAQAHTSAAAGVTGATSTHPAPTNSGSGHGTSSTPTAPASPKTPFLNPNDVSAMGVSAASSYMQTTQFAPRQLQCTDAL